MRKNYVFLPYDKDLLVVLCNSYLNPLNYISTLEKELKEEAYSGQLLFDLLLSNGNTSNRFFAAEVFNGKIKPSSIKTIKSIKSALLKKINNYYLENADLIDKSVLSDIEKFLVRKK